ncbi:MAG: OmpA family protein [Motiliproteus sp.]
MNKLLVIAAVSSLWVLSGSIFAHESVYVTVASGGFVKDGSGNCVRSSGWFKGSQIEGCDLIVRAPEPAPAPVVMAPLDGDGDGVSDSKDACKLTPRGIAVDMRGCPLDTDGDGVTDLNDKCPGTARGQKIDAKGCKLVEYKAVVVRVDVRFATNSDKIAYVNDKQMKALGDALAADPKSTVVIKGHTDSTGAAAYNKDLSQRRADAVAQRLITNYGFAPGQVSAVGYGEEMPIADNATAEGRSANRRVEALVEGTVKK